MAIPKIIHYCWFGGSEKPESVKKCISSWKKCSGYEIREWNEQNIDLSLNEFTKEAYEERAWGFVPDYLRLWIIYNYGGIYLDTDVQIIKSFDPLLKLKGFAGFEDEEHVSLGLGFGAEPGSQFLHKHMEVYTNIHYRNNDGTLNRIPSPYYTTELLKENGLDPSNGVIQNIFDFTIFPKEYFCPKSFNTGVVKITDNTYSIHQFDASWYSDEEKLQFKKWVHAAKKDYYLHTPNRFVKGLIGEKAYTRLKLLLKSNNHRHK